MQKITGVMMLFFLGVALYLLLYVGGFPVPLPKWYEKAVSEQADSIVARDPFLNLAKTTVKFRHERDSLQHIVDSLAQKQ